MFLVVVVACAGPCQGGEGGPEMAGSAGEGFLVGDVGGLEVEDTVGLASCNSGVHVLRVQ